MNNSSNATRQIMKALEKDKVCYVAKVGAKVESPLYYINDKPSTSKVESTVLMRNAINMEYLLQKSAEHRFEPISESTLLFISTLNNFFEEKGISPFNYFPISDGGANFEFKVDGKYYNIEVANDGEASLYKEEQGKIPAGWDHDYSGLINRLHKEFNG